MRWIESARRWTLLNLLWPVCPIAIGSTSDIANNGFYLADSNRLYCRVRYNRATLTKRKIAMELIPVSQWVYDLYKVEFWTSPPEEGGRLIETDYLASSCENHLRGDCDDRAPSSCTWYSWEIIKENVGQPRVIGNLYGRSVHEDAWTHGRRIFSQSGN